MLLVKVHTSLGITVTKKIYAFTQQNHDNYFIYDYVFKNTGIIDDKGTMHAQTLKDCIFYLLYRYTLAGESVLEYQEGWGAWSSAWGRNTVYQVVGTDPTATDFEFRAHYAWYGLHSERPITDDWGCPNEKEDGRMAAARYAGCVTLHADTGPHDQTDDLYQPKTTHYVYHDISINQNPYSQVDEIFMTKRYETMTMGHAEKTHAEEVGDGFADLFGGLGNGGYQAHQGFGPYTLEPGDSIHIVLAEGVAGISRVKNREVGADWLAWTNGTDTPTLIMPDGSETIDYSKYTR